MNEHRAELDDMVEGQQVIEWAPISPLDMVAIPQHSRTPPRLLVRLPNAQFPSLAFSNGRSRGINLGRKCREVSVIRTCA
jgi:hypothetical protein